MSKKKKRRKSQDKKTEIDPKVEKMNEDPFDFGGLPRRDLKKNLGCG